MEMEQTRKRKTYAEWEKELGNTEESSEGLTKEEYLREKRKKDLIAKGSKLREWLIRNSAKAKNTGEALMTGGGMFSNQDEAPQEKKRKKKR